MSDLAQRNLNSLIEQTPDEVAWGAVLDEEDFDFRRSCVDVLFANTIGVDDGRYSWSPNHNPPDMQERLAWIWLLRPDLSAEMLPHAREDLADLLRCYLDNRMNEWWSE